MLSGGFIELEDLGEAFFPVVLVLQGVLGFLQLLDVFDVVYYPTVHRETLTKRFDLGFSLVLPLVLLLLCWVGWMVRGRRVRLLAFPVLGLFLYPVLGSEGCVALTSLLAVAGGLWSHRCFGHFFFGVFGLLSLAEGLALLHWVVFVPLGWGSPVEGVAMLEMGLFYVSGYLAPLLVLPFLFMWFLKPLVHWGLNIKPDPMSSVRKDVKRRSRRAVLFLVFSVCLAVVAALYPFLSAVNPEGKRVGVDFPYYVEAAELVDSDPSQSFNVMGGSRPLIFLLIYGFQNLFGLEASVAVKFLPVFLNPLLAISVYFLTLEMLRDGWIAAWAAFFTVSGIQVTVGMYAYFLANLFGLSIILFSLGLFFRALRLGCRASLVFSCLVGGLLVFTHPWSFDHYFATAVLTAGFVWYYVRLNDGNFNFKIILIYLASLAFSEVLKVSVFQGVGGVSAISSAVRGISGLSKFWYNSIFNFRLLYGGTISFVVLLILAVMGVYLLGHRGFSETYFTVFPIVSSLLFLVGDEALKSRLLFNLPFGLYAALGFIWFLRREYVENLKQVFISFVVLSTAVYLFRSLANLV